MAKKKPKKARINSIRKLFENIEYNADGLSRDQNRMLSAMIITCGNVTASLRMAKISRCEYLQWLENDENFASEINRFDFRQMLIDLATYGLVQKLKEGEWKAIQLVLETQAGWTKQVEHNVNIAPQIVVDQSAAGFFNDGVIDVPVKQIVLEEEEEEEEGTGDEARLQR